MDGEDGEDGEDGTTCTVTDDGGGQITITCEDGTMVTVNDGQDGGNGQSWITRLDDEPEGANCEFGGTAVHTGPDIDADGVLDDDEIETTAYVCDGGGGGAGGPLCTTLEGSYEIRTGGDLSVLGLLGCSAITGTLFIEDFQYLTLSGLESLTSVGGLYMARTYLMDISALSGLVTVAGDLDLYDNLLLSDISPLGGITSVDGYVSIAETPIASPALSSLTSAGGLSITGDSLTSLEGLEQLTTTGQLELRGDFSTLAPLANLQSMAGGLSLTSPSLTDLEPLQGVTGIEGLYLDCPLVDSIAPLTLPAGPVYQLEIYSDAMSAVDLPITSVNDRFVLEGESFTTVAASDLQTVGGAVRISGPVTALDLGELTSAGALDLSSTSLSDVSGLAKLETVYGLHLRDNLDLDGLDGLAALDTSSLGEIELVGNSALIDISALAGATILTSLVVTHVPSLTAFSSVQSVNYLELGEGITTDSGLTSLTEVQYLTISGTSLSNIDGFGALTWLNQLFITCNESLTQIDGFGSLTAVLSLWIAGNPNLPQPIIDGLVAQTSPAFLDDASPDCGP